MFKKIVCVILTFALITSLFSMFGVSFALEEPLYSGVYKLSGEVISYTSTATKCEQIPCKEHGGIYFLNGNELGFLSVVDYSLHSVCTFFEDGMDFKNAYCTDDKIYVLFNKGNENAIAVYSLLNNEITKKIAFSGNVTAIGADKKGRIYLATSDASKKGVIHLLNADGELLSSVDAASRIEEFYGFDEKSGNFYVNSLSNWNYGGYDHDMDTLTVGNVSKNAITYDSNIVVQLSNSYYFDRQRAAELQGGRLLIESVVNNELRVYNTENASDATELVARIPRELVRENKLSSIGSRAIYNPDTNSVVAYKDDANIVEYDLTNARELCYNSTAYPVFALINYGDETIFAVEKNGDDFYIEPFAWKRATDFTVDVNRNIKVGESDTATFITNGYVKEILTWSSSNNKILSVNENGEIIGWSEGKATLTAKNNYGYSASVEITVSKNSETPFSNASVKSNGESSFNISKNNYAVSASPVNSYLLENADGTFSRVEYTGEKVLVETCESDMTSVKSALNLPCELEYFGGFFGGENYNFFVFGQKNEAESDEFEVVRVVKYDKNWNKIGSMSISGANTYAPFSSGSLRMTETDGKLYIHTCHKMYKSSDGLNHQANMIFVIDEENMELSDSFYEVGNTKDNGYVSHSFNQFIATDGDYVYRVDHGDAYPRGIAIVRSEAGGKVSNTEYVIPVSFEKISGGNATGASIGGFEVSTDSCLVAISSVNFAMDLSANDVRNICLVVSSKDLRNIRVVWFTNYSASDGVTVSTPHLVKIANDGFLLMWEEKTDSKTVTKMFALDGEGSRMSNTVEAPFRLSDCKPICCSDGSVRWYVTNGDSPTFYTVNPFDLEPSIKESTKGDINEDGILDIIDVAIARSFIVGSTSLNEKQISFGDMNSDGKLDIIDVVMMRKEIVG